MTLDVHTWRTNFWVKEVLSSGLLLLEGIYGKNVERIPEIVSHVINPLRVMFTLNQSSCQRAFQVLYMHRRK